MTIGPRALLALILCAFLALLPTLEGPPDAGAAAPVVGEDAGAPTGSGTESIGFGEQLSSLGQALTVTRASDAPPVAVPPTSAAPTTAPLATVARVADPVAVPSSIAVDDAVDVSPAPPNSRVAAAPTTSARVATNTPVQNASAARRPAVAPSTAAPALVAPVTAAPPTAPTQSLSRVDQMFALVNFDWRAAFPDWVVEFEGERVGVRALTFPAEKRVVVYVRGDDTPESLHRVFAHELGHVIDVELNSNDEREQWRQQRGLGGNVPWWPSAEAPDFATGAGDFAEAFAVLETGITTRSTVGAQPTSADLALMRQLMLG